MKASKFLLASIVGGVVYFFLGWLVYGILLMDFFSSQATNDVSRGDDMIWWSLILGNIFIGFLLAYIFSQWAGIKTFMRGLMGGAVIGVLLGAGMNFSMYGTSDMMEFPAVIADILVSVIMFGLTGGVVALVLGTGKEE